MEDITPEHFDRIIKEHNENYYKYIIDAIREEMLKGKQATSITFPKRVVYFDHDLESFSVVLWLNDYAIKRLKKNGFKVEKFKTKILRRTKYRVSWR